MARLTWSTVRSLATLGVLVASVVSTANAQRVTSEQRIPVRKESAGEVARRDSIARDSIARADSIARVEAARRDSLARIEAARADSVARIEAARRDSMARIEAARRDSIAREDSIRNAAAAAAAAAQAIPAALARRGFYLGLAGGASSPTGDYGDPYDAGWNITVPFGWQRAASRWGIRGDIAYDSHGGKSFSAGAVPPIIEVPVGTPRTVTSDFDVENGAIWSGNVDLTVDLAQWGANKLGALYLIGGGGLHYFDAPKFTITQNVPQQPRSATSFEGESQTKFGLNGGAGVAFGIGRTALFLESRYFTAYTDNANSSWVPIIVGLRWH